MTMTGRCSWISLHVMERPATSRIAHRLEVSRREALEPPERGHFALRYR